jgi:putative ABC transport system permease protein
VSHGAFDAYAPEMLDTTLWVVGRESTPQQNLQTTIAQAIRAYPNAELVDREGMRKTVVEEFNSFLGLVYAMLGMAVIIALLGIANTIGLSVTERTRELGLLRAVGTSRPQLRGMVRWEAAIIAVFGTLTGLAIGLFLGWAMVFAVRESGIETAKTVIPFGQLAIIVAIAAMCGVVAALLPARRAARLDVLKAIATT